MNDVQTHQTDQKSPGPGRPKSTYASVDELARELGLGRQTVYQALRSGQIPAIRVGKRYILPRAAIAEWLKSAARV